jgi:teichuronic acid biosynthesis glycosyltransferase TuaG
VSLLYTHNGEQCLREQIENVLQQSRTPECVLILDDGSNDHSVAIAESFAKSDERIRFIRDETNLGYVRTFEKGLSFRFFLKKSSEFCFIF